MSIETPTLPSSGNEAVKEPSVIDRIPTTEELQVIYDEENAENTDAVEAQEATASDPRSLRQRGIRRVADAFFDLSENLHARADTQAVRDNQNNAYDSYADNIATTKSRERTEFRENAADKARGFIRGIGRNARLAVIGARVEVGFVKAVASEKISNVVDSATEAYDSAKSTVTGVVEQAKDVYSTAKETVTDRISLVDTTINGTVEATKQRVTQEAEQFLSELTSLVESGANTVNSGIERAIAEKERMVAEYHQVKDAIGEAITSRVDALGNYFKDRKDAALARKAIRVAARNERKDQRSKERVINSRTANVELLKRLEQREINKTEAFKQAEMRKRGRAASRAALRTAVKVGFNTGKETYDTLKNSQ